MKKERLLCNTNNGSISNVNILTNTNENIIELLGLNKGKINNIRTMFTKKVKSVNTNLGKYSSIEFITNSSVEYNEDNINMSEFSILNTKNLTTEEKNQREKNSEFIVKRNKLYWKNLYSLKYLKHYNKDSNHTILSSQEDFDNFMDDLVLNKNKYENMIISLDCDVVLNSYSESDILGTAFSGYFDGMNHKIKVKLNNYTVTCICEKLIGEFVNTIIEITGKTDEILSGLFKVNNGLMSNINLYTKLSKKMVCNILLLCDVNNGIIENSLLNLYYTSNFFAFLLFTLVILLTLLAFKSCSNEKVVEDRPRPVIVETSEALESTTYSDDLNVMSFEFPYKMIINKNNMTGIFDFYAPERGNKDLVVEIWWQDECLYTSGLLKPGMNLDEITLNKVLNEGEYEATVFIVPYKDGRELGSLRTQLPFQIIVE